MTKLNFQMKYILIILFLCSFQFLLGCKETSNKDGDEIAPITESCNDNPFRMDSAHYYDFFKQAIISDNIRQNDSTYTSIAVVSELIIDSIETGDKEHNKLYLTGTKSYYNHDDFKHIRFYISHYDELKGDTLDTCVSHERFYQLLSSLKFIREKMNHKPLKSTLLYFNENQIVEIKAMINYPDTTWKFLLTLRKSEGDDSRRDIRLSTEKLDSVISIMNSMRTYFLTN